MAKLSWRFFFFTLSRDLSLEEKIDELKDYDQRFHLILEKHLALLGWWCFINLGIGLLGVYLWNHFWDYFFLMNISWAVINFSIVYWIFHHIILRKQTKLTVYQRFENQRHVDRMLLLNIGLDISYVFAGLYLQTLGRLPEVSHPELWSGFGWSILIQGVFLCIHDNVFYQLHRKNFKKAKVFLDQFLKPLH